jgi:DNA mismatch endonuclease (patch repair protein)
MGASSPALPSKFPPGYSALNSLFSYEQLALVMRRHFDTTAEVAKIMASIKKADTRPEVLLRKKLWKEGFRNYRKYPKLLGRPDLYFPAHRLVVFVDGCFWHGCPIHCRIPKKNLAYWTEKIAYNQRRDTMIDEELRSQGLTVLRIWEHDIAEDIHGAIQRVKSLVESYLDPRT